MVKCKFDKIFKERDSKKGRRPERNKLRKIAKERWSHRKKLFFIDYLSSKRKDDIILNKLLSKSNIEDEQISSSYLEILEHKVPLDDNKNKNGKNLDVKFDKGRIEDNNIFDEKNENEENTRMNSIIEEEKKEDEKVKMNDENKVVNDNEEINEDMGPLEGRDIVLIGETMIPKQSFGLILARPGARVSFCVNDKSSLLLRGKNSEDGRKYFEKNEYKTAVEKNITIYSDKEFEEYMQELTNDRSWNLKDQIQVMRSRLWVVSKKNKDESNESGIHISIMVKRINAGMKNKGRKNKKKSVTRKKLFKKAKYKKKKMKDREILTIEIAKKKEIKQKDKKIKIKEIAIGVIVKIIVAIAAAIVAIIVLVVLVMILTAMQAIETISKKFVLK